MVDTDPQCNATDPFGIDRDQLTADGRFTLADAYMSKKPATDIEYEFGERFEELLSVVPGHRGIGTTSHRLEAQLQAGIANGDYSDLEADDVKNEHRHRLKQSIDSLRGHRDVVLIDTPPDLGFLMTTALIASDWFVIPVFPSGYDLRGLEALIRNVNKVRDRYNPTLRCLGVLLGNIDARAKLDSDIYQMLMTRPERQSVESHVTAQDEQRAAPEIKSRSGRGVQRKQLNANPETIRMIEDLLKHIQTYSVQKDAKASEMFHGLVAALYEARELLDFVHVQPRGRWGSPTARAFPIALKNAFQRAIAEWYLKNQESRELPQEAI